MSSSTATERIMTRLLLLSILVVLLAAFFPDMLLAFGVLVGMGTAEQGSAMLSVLAVVGAALFAGWVWIKALPWALARYRQATSAEAVTGGVAQAAGRVMYGLIGGLFIFAFSAYVLARVAG
jgi:hypothetical protein